MDIIVKFHNYPHIFRVEHWELKDFINGPTAFMRWLSSLDEREKLRYTSNWRKTPFIRSLKRRAESAGHSGYAGHEKSARLDESRGSIRSRKRKCRNATSKKKRARYPETATAEGDEGEIDIAPSCGGIAESGVLTESALSVANAKHEELVAPAEPTVAAEAAPPADPAPKAKPVKKRANTRVRKVHGEEKEPARPAVLTESAPLVAPAEAAELIVTTEAPQPVVPAEAAESVVIIRGHGYFGARFFFARWLAR